MPKKEATKKKGTKLELKGQIIGIIYQNEINSYTIAELYDEENETTETIVGYLPFIAEGDSIKVIGKFVEHKEYGKQFKVDTFEKLMPETLEALEKYLGNGTIKGVGAKLAKKIVDTFQERTIDVIKYEPLELAKIKGITKERAQEISQSFIEHWEVWQIVGFLERFNIGVENAKKIYDKFGMNAIDEIEANPYVLIDLSRRVDFKQIDKMALDLGIDLNNSKRIKSGIKYALMQITYNGHCCTLLQNLEEYVTSLLGVSKDEIENNIINLKASGEIVIEERENEEEWVYLESFYKTEEQIANRILKLDSSKNVKYIKGIEEELQKIEKYNKIELSDKQKEAVKAVNENNVTIITGGPGTGKTTIIKSIIEIYEQRGKKVVLSAPTGRAAKRMTETTGKEASTLHRLLEIGKINEDEIYKSASDYQGAPIDGDIIIVDEVSMVDMFLMNYLLQCIYQGSKLILVGDVDQLSSVGPGSVLKDLIESEKITTIKLDKIFRQAAQSKIIVNAHRVNHGEGFITKEESDENAKQDFFFIKQSSQEKMLSEVISLCTGRLKKFGNYDFFSNIQVLTPTKKGLLGTKELNVYLQQALNPEDHIKSEKKSGSVTFRVGDRIMQVKNNYDIYWEKNSTKSKVKTEFRAENETGTGVFNGEIGTITAIDDQNKNVEIKFDDEKVAWYQFSELEQIEHSYAITIHKAQGSEFDVVIMCVPKAAPMLLTRNLLYTGITRAKDLLIIIGADDTINFMIQNVDSKKRNTGLKFKLKR